MRASWRRDLDRNESVFWTTCPFCGKLNDRHAPVGTPGAPGDGDATVCIGCQNVAIYEHAALGHLRKPTPAEQAELDGDELLQKVLAAMREVR